MSHVCGRGEVHTGFYRGSLKKKTSFGKPRHRWENNIKIDCKNGIGGHVRD